MPGEAPLVHRVRAGDGFAIVTADDPRASGGSEKGPANRADAWGSDVESALGGGGFGDLQRLRLFVPWDFHVILKAHGRRLAATYWISGIWGSRILMIDPPSNIRAHQGDQVLEVAWPDGRVDRFPYRFLRSECPCASCRDEWTGERIIHIEDVRENIQLEGMEAVGSYAIRPSWSDGHSSGILTWETLRELAAQIP